MDPQSVRWPQQDFLFVGYEGLRERSFSLFTATVTTDLERTGNLSQSLDPGGALIAIYDPRTTRLDLAAPAGVTRYIRTAFSGNTIPSDQLSPIAAAIMKYYPSPNQPGNGRSNTNNFFIAATNSLDADRVDLASITKYHRSASCLGTTTGSATLTPAAGRWQLCLARAEA